METDRLAEGQPFYSRESPLLFVCVLSVLLLEENLVQDPHCNKGTIAKGDLW
jgi:hypothetical protein